MANELTLQEILKLAEKVEEWSMEHRWGMEHNAITDERGWFVRFDYAFRQDIYTFNGSFKNIKIVLQYYVNQKESTGINTYIGVGYMEERNGYSSIMKFELKQKERPLELDIFLKGLIRKYQEQEKVKEEAKKRAMVAYIREQLLILNKPIPFNKIPLFLYV